MSNTIARHRLVCGIIALLGAARTFGADVQPDISDVATLPAVEPHWFFSSSFGSQAYTLFDGDTGRVKGTIPAGFTAQLAVAPDNSRFYVSETYWTHGNRGDRVDLVSVYDAKTLQLLKEISLPGRALGGAGVQNFALSADGSRAYVYVMHPAASVVWVDLKKQEVGGTIEIPGCGLVFPFGNSGFSSLCADGSLATVAFPAAGTPTVTHTKPFFDVNKDPIYDDGMVDRQSGKAIFMSYTGLVYPVTLGATPDIGKPWSIQQAAGYVPAGTGVQELAWRPGGRQLAAWQKSTGKLFVLMHVGNYWSHKNGGTEVWVLDTNSHSLLKRIPLQPLPSSGLEDDRLPCFMNLAVSQDAENPLIYLMHESGIVVMEANTGKILKKMEQGGDTAVVPGL